MTATERNVRTGWRGRHFTPVKLGLCALLFTGSAVYLFIYAFHLRSESALSAYTQAHGVGALATIISVQDSKESYENHHWTWRAQIKASLRLPVDGDSLTTVHVPHQFGGWHGETLRVLVDPRVPGYAELPGVPLRHRHAS